MKRLLLGLISVFVILLVTVLAITGAVLGTESGTTWLLGQAQSMAPGVIRVGSSQGHFFGRLELSEVGLSTATTERVTFEGSYNARARVAQDGRNVVMVHQVNGRFHIALLDLVTNRMQVLTSTELDESPSIAPNGSMVLYATKHAGRGILAAVSVDGGVKFRLPSREGDVREPAWSPFMSR